MVLQNFKIKAEKFLKDNLHGEIKNKFYIYCNSGTVFVNKFEII